MVDISREAGEPEDGKEVLPAEDEQVNILRKNKRTKQRRDRKYITLEETAAAAPFEAAS